MKLNIIFVALALSCSLPALAAPIIEPRSIEPRGLGSAWRAVAKALGKKGASSSSSSARVVEESVGMDTASETSPLSPAHHHGTPPRGYHVESPPPSHHSRESSEEPMSPPRLRQSVPGGAMVPFNPPPARAPERPYVPFEYTGPTRPVPPQGGHEIQPHYQQPAYLPHYQYPTYNQQHGWNHGGYPQGHRETDITPGYPYHPTYAHPGQSYSQYGGRPRKYSPFRD